ncbi:hypothetical protein LJC74_01110 [Eubacteriales bacterium OttesenSCG-928-A19]|nr:hypothetical protein [Eubacteriales bacterium OttesenSCG-928-A19]
MEWRNIRKRLPDFNPAWLIGAILGIALIILVVAVVDARPQLTAGTVTDKRYDAAHTTTWTRWQDVGDVRVPIQEKQHYPDTWSIQVEGAKEDGSRRGEWWSVGSGLYEQIGIGDQVKRDKDTGVVSVVWKK